MADICIIVFYQCMMVGDDKLNSIWLLQFQCTVGHSSSLSHGHHLLGHLYTVIKKYLGFSNYSHISTESTLDCGCLLFTKLKIGSEKETEVCGLRVLKMAAKIDCEESEMFGTASPAPEVPSFFKYYPRGRDFLRG